MKARGSGAFSLDRAVRAATRVLVADATETVRTLLCTIVEEPGYTVVQAADGEDAWRAWRREQAERIAAVVKRLSKLKNPQSVEYLQGSRMLDLSPSRGDEESDD